MAHLGRGNHPPSCPLLEAFLPRLTDLLIKRKVRALFHEEIETRRRAETVSGASEKRLHSDASVKPH